MHTICKALKRHSMSILEIKIKITKKIISINILTHADKCYALSKEPT